MSRWWDTLPEPVRAVVDMADLDLDDDTRRRIVDTFAPGHGDTLADMADKLQWIDRFRSEVACQVLSDYHGASIHGLYLDREADRIADEMAADVTTAAQLVASMLKIRSQAA